MYIYVASTISNKLKSPDQNVSSIVSLPMQRYFKTSVSNRSKSGKRSHDMVISVTYSILSMLGQSEHDWCNPPWGHYPDPCGVQEGPLNVFSLTNRI